MIVVSSNYFISDNLKFKKNLLRNVSNENYFKFV